MARTKITEDSANAFKMRKLFKRSNTVVRNNTDWTTDMYLFGNLIAKYKPGENKLWINACWRDTVTTKERLNWILEKFNAWYIYQKNYVWYYMDKEGNAFTMPIHNVMLIDLNDYSDFTFLQL